MFVENQNVEWKEIWKDDYLKQICSFANTNGGILYIGVNNKGKVVGVKDAIELMDIIPQKSRALLGITVESKLKKKKGLEYLIIRVDKHSSLISYKGKYYLRSGSNTYEANGIELDRIILSRIGKRWEEIEVDNLKNEEISENAINKFKEKAISSGKFTERELDIENEKLLKNLKLYNGKSINYAGILLFSNDPEYYIRGSYIKIGLFAYDNLSLVEQKEIHGPILLQLDKTMSTLNRYLKELGVDYNKRKIITYTSIKELILNSIMHKSYDSYVPTQIKVYKNKIVIWNSINPGIEIKISELSTPHPANPTNPLIVNTFFRCGECSSWGIGLEKIKEDSVKNQVPMPKFRITNNGLMVKIRRKVDVEQVITNNEKANIDKNEILDLLLRRDDISTNDIEKILTLKKQK